jgi:alkylated DNA repair dioxygenase AlkB
VARAPSEEPEGIAYRPEILTVDEETERRRVWEIALEPRSGYVLSGEARRSWEHSIPAVKERRYSITFRTLRNRN